MIAAVGPVLVGLVVGWGLRRTGVGTGSHGRFLLRLNFYVCMPALVLPAVADAELDRSLLAFPAAAAVMVAAGFAIGRGVGAVSAADPEERAVITMAFMVVNCAFALPFVGAVYGAQGVLLVAAFDLVHGLLVATVVLAVAARADPRTATTRGGWTRDLTRTPLLYATGLGAVLNLAGWSLPTSVTASLEPFASASLGVVALGAGMVVEPLQGSARVTALALVRAVAGVAIAGVLVAVLGLDGTERGVLLMLGLTPLGFVVVTFAATHHLATRLGVNLLLVTTGVSVAAYAVIAATA